VWFPFCPHAPECSQRPGVFTTRTTHKDPVKMSRFCKILARMTLLHGITPCTTLLWTCLLVTLHAAPIEPEQHMCAQVELVRTNLPEADALKVVNIFMEETSARGLDAPEPLSKRLAAEHHTGFWDVYFVGSAFSYSVTCSTPFVLGWNR